jgi:hypothetical protein
MELNWGICGLRGSITLENKSKRVGTYDMVDYSNCQTFITKSKGLVLGKVKDDWSMTITITPGDVVTCHVNGCDGTSFPHPISSIKVEFAEYPCVEEEIKKMNMPLIDKKE